MDHHLGKGVLTWARIERVSDRYGTVYLIPDGHNSETPDPSTSLVDGRVAAAVAGRHGDLIARVLEARKSTHIGDLFRGFKPRRTDDGAEIRLGAGEFFVERAPEGGDQIGLRPPLERDTDWLDPRGLYDVHEHLVELIFRERST